MVDGAVEVFATLLEVAPAARLSELGLRATAAHIQAHFPANASDVDLRSLEPVKPARLK